MGHKKRASSSSFQSRNKPNQIFLQNLSFYRPSRFKQYSVVQQQKTDHHETDTNLAFTIPREFITCQNLTSGSLFHG
jgi:hypothetical protein